MHIEDDLKLHSHLLGDLYDKEKVLRERQHELRETQLSQSHTIKQNTVNIMDTLEMQKSNQELAKENQLALMALRSEFNIFKSEKKGWQIAIEGLRNPRHWIPIIGLILLIESIKGLEIAKLIKYFTGL